MSISRGVEAPDPDPIRRAVPHQRGEVPVGLCCDAAALQPIIEEAGGVFTDWLGAPTVFGGSAIATNRLLADEVRAVLAQTNPSTPP